MSTQSNQPKKSHVIDVQPIRSLDQINDMKWALKRHCSERDYILFSIGIATGLRVSDLLKLTVNQIISIQHKAHKEFTVTEGKTKKPRTVRITSIYDGVFNYACSLNSTYLFPSRQGDKAISSIRAYQSLNKAAEYAGLESIGTHTMRKTFGYWTYKKSEQNIAMVQQLLNHSHPSITLRYIGVDKEEKDNVLDNLFS